MHKNYLINNLRGFKKVILTLAAALITLTAFSCNQNATQDDTGVYWTGNNYRLKKVIEKLRNGDDVYIAAIGGSVTEGEGPADYTDGYFYQFCNKLKETYTSNNGANVHTVNAGLCGTPSTVGLVRYKADVVDALSHTPDLLIVEFAVNDEASDQVTRAYEAIIRNALTGSSNTAVIALHSAATYASSAPTKIEIGKHYNIPQINVQEALNKAIATRRIKSEEYFKDSVHPTKKGHEFQADCLMTLFEKIDNDTAANSYSVPSNWTRTPNKSFANFIRITGSDDNVKITAGGFSGTDANTQGFKKGGSPFSQNWYKSSSSANDEFSMTLTCKGLILIYKQQGTWLSEEFGKAVITVDGSTVGTYDGGAAGGWNNCIPVVLIDGVEEKEHTIKIKMASGDEGKGFTICGMGYSTSNGAEDPAATAFNEEELAKYSSLINSLANEYNMAAFTWDLFDSTQYDASTGAGYIWRKKMEMPFPTYIKAAVDAYPKSTDKGNSGDDDKFEEETSFTAVKNFKAGWNLSNSLDSNSYYPGQESDGWIGKKTAGKPANYEKTWYQPETTQDIADYVLAQGFNSIRVPVTWIEHLDSENKVDSDWMARVKEVVDYFYNRGVYVIVNVHHDGGGTGWVKASKDSWDNNKGRFETLWTQIATTFKDYDERLVFESVNEVLDGNASWNKPSTENYGYLNNFNQLFVTTVRGTGGNNEKRNLIVMTYAGAGYFDDFKIPTDTVKNHIIMEVHDYNPTPFCWSEKQVTWTKCTALWNGSVNVEKTIRDNLASYKAAAEKFGVPLIIGEYNASPKRYCDYDQ